LLILSDRILDSRVVGAMPRLGQPRRKVRRTAPALSRRAASIISFSLSGELFGEVQRGFRFGRKRLLSKTGLVDREILCFAHDDRSLEYTFLQFADVPGQG